MKVRAERIKITLTLTAAEVRELKDKLLWAYQAVSPHQDQSKNLLKEFYEKVCAAVP